MRNLKASELRIGNYCRFIYGESSKYCQIDGSDILALSDDPTLKMPTTLSVQPIRLIERWLLDFGFYKEEQHECYLRYSNETEDFKLEKQGGCGAYYLWGGEDAPHLTQFLGHHKYVHQLQNLYFALIGEELEKKNI